MTPQRATLTGLLAIVLWSTSVGLIRSLTEALGPIGGAAMIYSTSTLCLLAFYGLPRIKTLPRIYLFAGGAMFVCYEIFLSLSIGLADSRMQAIEIGMINYLWPSLTILFSLFINQQKSRFLLWPGLALALGGIVWIMKGESDWTPELLWNNVLANPLAYSLAFSAALTWALYCNITKRYGQGKSGVSLFFLITALILWTQYSFSGESAISLTLPSSLQLIFMGASTALAYSAWNAGIQHGNLTLLATASYFTPVLSTLLAALWLNITPAISFWQGVAMVTAGSLLCWYATRTPTS
ncbi:aromatic amino acid DMT transporter YddG [Pectobacterium carotovorum]|uniref:aromatic amino acid DMT transporter YddG n=1 Tax=Pectobacterium carotovorum TaxID=554 RepID=UPI00050379C7|nr:aromatic amino acid DMT transporter YddG [Pectobacterium carotovorum]KAA3668468.1 drug/metabolite DMT transporter permease [Pectobacterium carotovorum subsp. carotovorum]KFW99618.1 aromatic amino acid exporter [Pectobacterium carotovorum subsp. carotovorum]KML69767.1 aromatic amino acid exporter [Pectobacterium carotovorum subsp. carotovorum ICMP 5702]MCH4996590.1 aromatic amino acid DMT transporter YddG [Pectobacterium carotovorum]UCZ81466.1 aromatic amino acid DMT transporter YddG [Pectob